MLTVDKRERVCGNILSPFVTVHYSEGLLVFVVLPGGECSSVVFNPVQALVSVSGSASEAAQGRCGMIGQRFDLMGRFVALRLFPAVSLVLFFFFLLPFLLCNPTLSFVLAWLSRCFGLLLSPGKNVKNSDMHLLDLVSEAWVCVCVCGFFSPFSFLCWCHFQPLAG